MNKVIQCFSILVLWSLMAIPNLCLADDIDIFLSAASDYGLDANKGNSSTITLILDDSISMIEGVGAAPSEVSNKSWWQTIEKRTAMKNGVIDFISASPGDLKIVPMQMNELADDIVRPAGEFLNKKIYTTKTSIAGNDYRQRVVDDDSLGLYGVDVSAGKYYCFKYANDTRGYTCSNTGYYAPGTSVDLLGFNADNPTTNTYIHGLALHFPMPGYGEDYDFDGGLPEASDLENRDITGIFMAGFGFPITNPGEDNDNNGIVDDPADNTELLIRVYNTDDLNKNSSDAQYIFAEDTSTVSVQPIAEFTTDFYQEGYKEDGHYHSSNRYHMPADEVAKIAPGIKDGTYEELSFVIYKKNKLNANDYYIYYYWPYVELHIETESTDKQEITAPVFTPGSDAIELSDGNVYDLNEDEYYSSSSSLYQEMRELQLNQNSKVALRFMLLPFDQDNDHTIDDIQLRLFPASTISSAVNLDLGINSLNPGEVIPISDNGISGLWDSADTKNTVSINVTDWNNAVNNQEPYDIALPSNISNAIVSSFGNTSLWEYHNALTMVLSSESSQTLHFHSYEQSHALYKHANPGSATLYSQYCLGNKQMIEFGRKDADADSVKLRMCEQFISPRLVFNLNAGVTIDSSLFPSTEREQLIKTAYEQDVGGVTPLLHAYAVALNYLYGYYNIPSFDNLSSPLVDIPNNAKSCGFFDSIVLLTDGISTAHGQTEYLSETLKDLGGIGWTHAGNVAEYLSDVNYGHDTDGDQNPGNNKKFGMNSYGVRFGYIDTTGLNTFVERAGTAVYNEDGDARPYTAVSSYELVKAFQSIQSDALFISSQISSSPAPSVNPVNSFETSDELYYPLYKPNDQKFWPGNMKRYSFRDIGVNGISNFQTVDVNFDPIYPPQSTSTVSAVNPDSVSWWTDVPVTRTVTNAEGETVVELVSGASSYPDGQEVAAGGAAEETANDSRVLLSYIPGSLGSSVNDIINPLVQPGTLVTETVTNYYEQWGFDNTPASDEASSVFKVVKGAWGAVIHNQPKIVSHDLVFDSDGYVTSSENTIYYGDNAGYLHAIAAGEPTSDDSTINNANTGGEELWAFAPMEVLPNFKRFVEDQSFSGDAAGYRTRYVYGVDGQIEILAYDKNRDGDYLDYYDEYGDVTTDSSDFEDRDRLNLYFGLRRGGSAYYALDIRNSFEAATGDTKPNIMFRHYSNHITNSVTVNSDDSNNIRLDRLAETWSPIQKAIIKWDGQDKNVIIFGGGYDETVNETQDGLFSATVSNSAQMGNAIYVADADTGKIYGYVSHSITDQNSDAYATGASGLAHSEMIYSIPGKIATIDFDQEGVDALYATDTGGQLFRVLLNPKAGITESGAVVPLFSNVQTIAKLGKSVASNIADYRSFYTGVDADFVIGQFDDTSITNGRSQKGNVAVAFGSGFIPELKNNEVQDYIFGFYDEVGYDGDINTLTTTLTIDNFYNATNVTGATISSQGESIATEISNNSNLYGWRIQLDSANAEKVIGEPKIVSDRIFLSVFNNSGAGTCSDSIGQTSSYGLSVYGSGLFTDDSGNITRIFDTVAGFTDTGSIIANTQNSGQVNFLLNSSVVCLENCENNNPPICEDDFCPAPIIQEVEGLIRTKWRQCIDSNFTNANSCGSDL